MCLSLFYPLFCGLRLRVTDKRKHQMNVRAAAANVLFQVVDKGQSLSRAYLPLKTIKPRDYALLQEICYGALRFIYLAWNLLLTN